MRNVLLLCAAILVATVAFRATMIGDPPGSVAFDGTQMQAVDPNSLLRLDVPMSDPADAF
jgi:hypothetical protein